MTRLPTELRGSGEHALYLHGKCLPSGDNVPIRDVGAHRRPVVIPPQSFGPAVPPKDQASQDLFVSGAPKMGLDMLMPERMLDHLILSSFLAGKEHNDDPGSDSDEASRHRGIDVMDGMTRSEDHEARKARETKRDTVENLVHEIQLDMPYSTYDTPGGDDSGIRSSIVPHPLHLRRKPTHNPNRNRKSTVTKLNTINLDARPSLRIDTNFTSPRLAPLPIAQHWHSDTQAQTQTKHAYNPGWIFGSQKRSKAFPGHHTARGKREKQLGSQESEGCCAAIITAAKGGYENIMGLLKPELKAAKVRRRKEVEIKKKLREWEREGS